ncbi:MAG: response regulator [Methylococcaceae bacterium]|nr:response regulator [Methylococcaceae bacterium]
MTAQDFSVLIADDNELNLWLLCEQLRHWTTNISAAKDGREAWQLLKTQKYSLIFLDMNMPFWNGLELIEKLRSSETPNHSTPAIAVTAHVHSEQHQALIAAGFSDCLVKPVLLKHLKSVMEQWRDTVNAGPEYYARQILKKTVFDHELSQRLLNKLFEEAPKYLLGIDQSLQEPDYHQAWQIAHKLHGTFSFYGFADFLPMADRLEECLLKKDGIAANKQLRAMQERFSSLLDNKAAILARVAAEATKDLGNPP